MANYLHEEISVLKELQVVFRIYEDSNHLIPSHWHNSVEIIYIYEGILKVTTSDRVYALEQGDFILINSADIHATLCDDPVRVLLLQIPYDFLKESIPDYDYIRFHDLFAWGDGEEAVKKKRICDILEEMGKTFEQQEGWYALHFKGLLYELLFTVMEYCREDVSPAIKIKSIKNLERLETIMEYVKQHYMEPVALKEAAGAVALNPEYFCRYFKKYMGQTFQEYINTVRLTHVCTDLLTTDLTVTTILERHGFTNYKIFMRMFKETYHCTPQQLRKKMVGHGSGGIRQR